MELVEPKNIEYYMHKNAMDVALAVFEVKGLVATCYYINLGYSGTPIYIGTFDEPEYIPYETFKTPDWCRLTLEQLSTVREKSGAPPLKIIKD